MAADEPHMASPPVTLNNKLAFSAIRVDSRPFTALIRSKVF
jgi:hypothetical protein